MDGVKKMKKTWFVLVVAALLLTGLFSTLAYARDGGSGGNGGGGSDDSASSSMPSSSSSGSFAFAFATVSASPSGSPSPTSGPTARPTSEIRGRDFELEVRGSEPELRGREFENEVRGRELEVRGSENEMSEVRGFQDDSIRGESGRRERSNSGLLEAGSRSGLFGVEFRLKPRSDESRSEYRAKMNSAKALEDSTSRRFLQLRRKSRLSELERSELKSIALKHVEAAFGRRIAAALSLYEEGVNASLVQAFVDGSEADLRGFEASNSTRRRELIIELNKRWGKFRSDSAQELQRFRLEEAIRRSDSALGQYRDLIVKLKSSNLDTKEVENASNNVRLSLEASRSADSFRNGVARLEEAHRSLESLRDATRRVFAKASIDPFDDRRFSGNRGQGSSSRFDGRSNFNSGQGSFNSGNGGGFDARGPDQELRGQESEVRGREFEVRGRESEFEIRGREPEFRGREFENEVRGRESELEPRGREFEAKGRESEIRGRLSGSSSGSSGGLRGRESENRGSGFEDRPSSTPGVRPSATPSVTPSVSIFPAGVSGGRGEFEVETHRNRGGD